MKRANLLIWTGLLSLLLLPLCGCQSASSPTPSPVKLTAYLDMAEPGPSPVTFAPGLLPPENMVMHSYPAFAPDLTELYFSAYSSKSPRLDAIMFMKKGGNGWGPAEVAPFSGEFNDNWPWFSPDGQRLYFTSDRPPPGGETQDGLWVVERTSAGWSSPRPIQTPADFGRDEGTLYVSADLPGGFGDLDIYRLAYQGDSYAMPENLGQAINTPAEEYGPSVPASERFMVFARFVQDAAERQVDLYVAFRRQDGTWTQALNMSATDEAFGDARFPGLSPDGEYLFFVPGGGQSVQWVEASVVERFRTED